MGLSYYVVVRRNGEFDFPSLQEGGSALEVWQEVLTEERGRLRIGTASEPVSRVSEIHVHHVVCFPEDLRDDVESILMLRPDEVLPELCGGEMAECYTRAVTEDE